MAPKRVSGDDRLPGGDDKEDGVIQAKSKVERGGKDTGKANSVGKFLRQKI